MPQDAPIYIHSLFSSSYPFQYIDLAERIQLSPCGSISLHAVASVSVFYATYVSILCWDKKSSLSCGTGAIYTCPV